jgi:hypothetical protein
VLHHLLWIGLGRLCFKIKNKKDHANSTEKVPIQESFHICSRLITQKDVLLLEQVSGQMGRVFPGNDTREMFFFLTDSKYLTPSSFGKNWPPFFQ